VDTGVRRRLEGGADLISARSVRGSQEAISPTGPPLGNYLVLLAMTAALGSGILYRAKPRIDAGWPGSFMFGPTWTGLPFTKWNTCRSLSM
jgi:hypothetical protein